MKTIIFGGGTFSHVRSHLALAAPAFGTSARYLYTKAVSRMGLENVELFLTKMADPLNSNIVTNEDLYKVALKQANRPDVGAIVLNAALCDWNGEILDSEEYRTQSGKYESRLESISKVAKMHLVAAGKILPAIRLIHPNLVLVGFKTTCGEDFKQMEIKAKRQMQGSGTDMVLVNDVKTRQNALFTKNGSVIPFKDDRDDALDMLTLFIHEQIKIQFPSVDDGNV